MGIFGSKKQIPPVPKGGGGKKSIPPAPKGGGAKKQIPPKKGQFAALAIPVLPVLLLAAAIRRRGTKNAGRPATTTR